MACISSHSSPFEAGVVSVTQSEVNAFSQPPPFKILPPRPPWHAANSTAVNLVAWITREGERENTAKDKAQVMWAACSPTRCKRHSAEGFN